MENRSTAELVSLALSGDKQAYGTLFEMTYRQNHFLASKALGSDEAAAKVLEKSYTQAFAGLAALPKPEAFKQWLLLKTAVNTAELLKAQGTDFSEEADGEEGYDDTTEFLPADYVQTPGAVDFSVAMLDYLPAAERFTALLRYFCSMQMPAVVRVLGCSEKAAGQKLMNVRKAFKDKVSVEPYAGEGKPILTSLLDMACRRTDFDKNVCKDIFSCAVGAVSADDNGDFTFRPIAPPRPINMETNGQDRIKELSGGYENVERTERPRVRRPGGGQAGRGGRPSRGKKPSQDGVLSAIRPFADKCEDFLSSVTGKKIDDKLLAVIAAGVVAFIILLIIIASAIAKNGKAKNDEPQTTTKPLIVTTTVPSEITSDDGKYVWKSSKVLGAYTDIDYFNESSIVFKSPGTGKYGLLDLKGNILIEPRYETFRHCSDGKAYYNHNTYHYIAVLDNTDYLIDTDTWTVGNVHSSHSGQNQGENWYVPGGFEEKDRYFNDLAAAKKNGKWGYVDRNDKEVIPFEYESTNEKCLGFWPTACDFCSPFSEDGYAPVCKDGKFGIIDKENNVIVPFEYERIMPGSDGVFIAEKDGAWGFIGIGTTPKEPEV